MAAPAPTLPTWNWGSFTTGFFVGAILVFIIIIVLANTLPAPGTQAPEPLVSAPSPSPETVYSPSPVTGFS